MSTKYNRGFVSKIQVFLKERREKVFEREKELKKLKKKKSKWVTVDTRHHKLKGLRSHTVKMDTRTEMVVRTVSKRLILRKCIAYALVTLSFKHQTEVTKQTPGPHTLEFPK